VWIGHETTACIQSDSVECVGSPETSLRAGDSTSQQRRRYDDATMNTQCIHWKVVFRPPRGTVPNSLINEKELEYKPIRRGNPANCGLGNVTIYRWRKTKETEREDDVFNYWDECQSRRWQWAHRMRVIVAKLRTDINSPTETAYSRNVDRQTKSRKCQRQAWNTGR